MNEIIAINLDNEMDLIMAHKRCIKIAELCGLPSAAQTRFSTAVSEVARCAISNGEQSILQLGIQVLRPTQKNILAVISDKIDLKKCNPEPFAYASRISGNVEYQFENGFYTAEISHTISSPGLITDTKIKGFKEYFKTEPPISPYDEIRKKNIELIALSEKLGESENKYRQLTNTLPLLIYTVDDRNRIDLANNWANQYLDVPATFDKMSLASIIHKDDVNLLADGWEKAKVSRSGFRGQVRVKHNGGYYWHLITVTPNKNDDTGKETWIVVFVDINAQKLVEETLKDNSELKVIQGELEKKNTELSAKNKELEQFAFVASHDLQEPLRKIMIMISRATEKLNEKQKGEMYLDRIGAAADRMSNLIADVLNYARIDNFEKDIAAVDLNGVVNDTLNDLDFAIQEKNAVINVSPLPIINGVAAQLRQLFFNLINNSLKFNRMVPHIEIAAVETGSAQLIDGTTIHGNFNLITLADNGIGMDEQYSSKIFNMFHRLHHRDLYGGNGIGLALCRRIIENHGGYMSFTSEPDRGTTFYVYLPFAD